ncbi:hypothetical protein Glove_187g107 [Diversispora epigaea]|uniref:Uncharacterized protein n=1 Tax=Diversispora epigaea TaxID=1348612 RepID=A0A397IW90_9GLOM|nr:hypothetical protein Glove_187g107 [Diversispora epigaea]
MTLSVSVCDISELSHCHQAYCVKIFRSHLADVGNSIIQKKNENTIQNLITINLTKRYVKILDGMNELIEFSGLIFSDSMLYIKREQDPKRYVKILDGMNELIEFSGLIFSDSMLYIKREQDPKVRVVSKI